MNKVLRHASQAARLPVAFAWVIGFETSRSLHAFGKRVYVCGARLCCRDAALHRSGWPKLCTPIKGFVVLAVVALLR